VQFLAGENITRAVIEKLREGGFVVESVAESLSGASDTDVLAAARINGPVLITEDRASASWWSANGVQVRGVLLLELDRLSNSAEADRVLAVVRKYLAAWPLYDRRARSHTASHARTSVRFDCRAAPAGAAGTC